MKRFVLFIFLVVFCSFIFVQSTPAKNLVNFTIPFSNLTTPDPLQPVTFQFTASNATGFSVSMIGASGSIVGPDYGTFALSSFTSGLSSFTPYVLSSGSSVTDDFGTFTFDAGTPVGTTQDLSFTLMSQAFTTTGFAFDVDIKSASATVVPEPSSILLLAFGLFGFAGFGARKKFRKK